MSSYQAPTKDIEFLINDAFKLEQHWAGSDIFSDWSAELAGAIVNECAKISEGVLAPINREGDEVGCQLQSGQVITPPGFKDAWDAFAEGGWQSMPGSLAYGGQGMPKTITSLLDEMLFGANSSFALYSTLSVGAALAIEAHASEELKNKYLPPIYEGRWAGAMDLTEPHSGSDLGIIRTKAVDNGDGSFAISGTKIFITGGDQDLTENVIHLVLAKLPDAPAGPRGISLFLVPKIKVNEDGSLHESNGVSVGSIEHKMGIKASATCVMNFDSAEGYLVGEINRGLNAMFTMMNYERLSIGIQGTALAHASYVTARDYALDRIQGRSPLGVQAPEKQADPIIHHADVRRMLMTQRALVEAGRAFSVYLASQLDQAKCAKSAAEKAALEARGALLTPIAKAFFSDMGLDATVLGQQVLGGHGFIREWGQEQHVRDARIAQIYEGTNGIQAQDLVRRKVAVNGGEWLNAYLDEMIAFTDAHDLKDVGVALRDSVGVLRSATSALLEQMKEDPSAEGAASVEYLHLCGYVSYQYMWAIMVAAADEQTEFGATKHKLAQFYTHRILPRISSLSETIHKGSVFTMAFTADEF